MIDSRVEAENILSPYLDKLANVVTSAVESYSNMDPAVKAIHSPRTRSSNINDYIKHYVIGEMTSVANVRISTQYGQLRLKVGDKFQLVFKKLRRDFLPSYSRTERWRKFMNQESDELDFPDMPTPVTNAIVGYHWDSLSSAQVHIVCPKGETVEWKLEILPTAAPSMVEPTFVPPAKRVVPKRHASKKAKE